MLCVKITTVIFLKEVLFAALLAVNVIGVFLVFGDKRRAKSKKRRTKESTFWLLSLLGAAGGIFVSMLMVRHKTNHISFMLLLPLIAVAQTVLLLVIF